MIVVALDMGGSHIGCAIVSDRRILASKSIDSERATSLRSILPAVSGTIRELMAAAGVSASDCAAVTVGFPGIVEGRSGKVLSTLKKYEDAVELDLPAWSREAFDLPLRLENDARMALLGEQYAGAAQGAEDVVMMTLGTGIGAAAMIHGALLRGRHGQAACLGGHLTVSLTGRRCVCGNIGCAEAEAAGWSLPLIAREWSGFAESLLAQAKAIDFRTLFLLADHGDAVSLAILDRCLQVWSASAVALIHAYDPEVLILGGGVMNNGERILPGVRAHVARHACTPWGQVVVKAAMFPETAALLGAIPLLREEL